MPRTHAAPITRARRELHAHNEPANLYGAVGQPLERGVYNLTIKGGEYFVGINAAGDVIASIRFSMKGAGSADAEIRTRYVECYFSALARCWIEVERLDPSSLAGDAFPECRVISRPASASAAQGPTMAEIYDRILAGIRQ